MRKSFFDIYTIYELEAEKFGAIREKKRRNTTFLLGQLLKVSGMIFLMSGVVFFIVNFSFIRSQIKDWLKGDFQSNFDSDGDGISDFWEKKFNTSITDSQDSFRDLDGDGLNNIVEFNLGTNLAQIDSDQDGLSDQREVYLGFNPNGKGSFDSDGDKMDDWWEKLYGLNFQSSEDSQNDLDGDGLINQEEFVFRTNPQMIDTDRDGSPDGLEIKLKTNPLDKKLAPSREELLYDFDNDNLGTEAEIFWGTDPYVSDSDDDGELDGDEILKGHNPKGEGNFEIKINFFFNDKEKIELAVAPFSLIEREKIVAWLKNELFSVTRDGYWNLFKRGNTILEISFPQKISVVQSDWLEKIE